MHFDPPPETAALVRRVREIVDGELVPLEPRFLVEGLLAVLPALAEARERIKRAGLWAPNHPREYGGLGLDLVSHGLVSEALGRSPLGHYAFGCHAPDAGNI